jgi:peptidoglycan/xylan/chitin deacetylase (PgdA/CDA1 family)
LLSVSPSVFRQQLQALRTADWESLSVAQYTAQINSPRPEPRKLLITFDDGYRNFAEHAWPLLKEFGLRATLFVPVDFVGKRPLWLERDGALTRPLLHQVRVSNRDRITLKAGIDALMQAPLLDWPDLRSLAEEGVDVQSHGFAHHFLTKLPMPEVARDLIRSRETLEDRLGLPIRAIAYPYGVCDPSIAACARQSGFEVGFVSDHGPRDSTHMMAWRGGVSSRLTPPELLAILETWPLYPRIRHLSRRLGSAS